MQYVKLNTNESPYPPSKKAVEYALAAAKTVQLYSDPECRDLVKKAAEVFSVDTDEIIFTNGSDEVLQFAFMAFCDSESPAIFPDITYGFYSVFAELNRVPYTKIPLREDFTVDINDYIGKRGTVFLANPNAPTGIAIGLCDIEKIVSSNPDRVVVIDEAYVDFGAESAVPLIKKYDNLLVTGTFSKSRSMAGARLGYGIGASSLIRDLNTMKYSTNPYNVNRMTAAMGLGTLEESEYTKENCRRVIATREKTASELRKLGFTMTDSVANFIFAKHKKIGGKELYLALKERGVLVRHFDSERLKDYNRITVGSESEMQTLVDRIKEILEEAI